MTSLPETKYAKSGDLSIAYQVVGEGPRDLIYVPAIISHVEFFHELPGYTEFLNGLGSFARVIVFDKRGNGLSDRIAGVPRLEERMDDIPALMEAVGSQRATLFSVSEGGPISLMFAATYPDRVEAMVLYETFVRYGGLPGHSVGWEPDPHEQFTAWMLETYGTGASLGAFGTSWANDPHVQELWGRAERLSNSPGGFRAVYEALLETDVRTTLPSVRAPCLVMHGANGSMFEHQSRYLTEHLPDARLVALDGVDHFPWFAGGDRIVAEVEEFLTGLAVSTFPKVTHVDSQPDSQDQTLARYTLDVVERAACVNQRESTQWHEVDTVPWDS